MTKYKYAHAITFFSRAVPICDFKTKKEIIPKTVMESEMGLKRRFFPHIFNNA